MEKRSSGDLRRRFSWSSRNVGSDTSSRAGKARSPPIRKPYQLPSCSFARSLPDRLSMHFSVVACLFRACRRSRQADSPIEVCSSCLRWDSLIVPSCRALFRDTGFDDTLRSISGCAQIRSLGVEIDVFLHRIFCEYRILIYRLCGLNGQACPRSLTIDKLVITEQVFRIVVDFQFTNSTLKIL